MIYMIINKLYFGDYLFFLTEDLSFNTTKQLIFPFKETYLNIIALFQNSNLSNQGFMTARGWNAIFSLYVLVISLIGIWKVKWEYTFYSLSSILIFCSLSWGISNARYAYAVFPMFIILGSMKNKLLQASILGLFLVLLLYFTRIFTSGSWAF